MKRSPPPTTTTGLIMSSFEQRGERHLLLVSWTILWKESFAMSGLNNALKFQSLPSMRKHILYICFLFIFYNRSPYQKKTMSCSNMIFRDNLLCSVVQRLCRQRPKQGTIAKQLSSGQVTITGFQFWKDFLEDLVKLVLRIHDYKGWVGPCHPVSTALGFSIPQRLP